MALQPKGKISAGRVGVAAQPGRDIHPAADIRHNLVEPALAEPDFPVGGGAGGRRQADFASVIGVNIQLTDGPVFDQGEGFGRDAFGVVIARGQPADAERIVDKREFVAEPRLAEQTGPKRPGPC